MSQSLKFSWIFGIRQDRKLTRSKVFHVAIFAIFAEDILLPIWCFWWAATFRVPSRSPNSWWPSTFPWRRSRSGTRKISASRRPRGRGRRKISRASLSRRKNQEITSKRLETRTKSSMTCNGTLYVIWISRTDHVNFWSFLRLSYIYQTWIVHHYCRETHLTGVAIKLITYKLKIWIIPFLWQGTRSYKWWNQ